MTRKMIPQDSGATLAHVLVIETIFFSPSAEEEKGAWTKYRAHCYNLRMLRKPMPVLSALAVLLLPVCPAQQQASTAANAASAKEGAAVPSERGRILGIGGIFFKSANQQQMREWYGKHLGLADKGGGVMMPWREKDNPEKEHVTV